MSAPAERIGVVTINFGEPPVASPETVEPFLERIFLLNAGLEPDESARRRARQLARDRAPGLILEYQSIGGSPLNEQADAQAERLGEVLAARGLDVRTYSAFQFTEPSVEDALAAARDGGAERIVVLPVYPLCGRSTTVAALESASAGLETMGWEIEFTGIAGWHQHQSYTQLRADSIRDFVATHGVGLQDADTLLYFSAHGTPLKYLDEGNRYDRYVEEHCRAVAASLGADRYAVGFQNHTNRRVRWTQPDNEDAIRAAAETTLVVVPISFMHEQSETLAELDHDLRAYAEDLGKRFLRVPVPHDAPAFDSFLADLVASALSQEGAPAVRLVPCRCAVGGEIRCTNGDRDLPPSSFAPPAV